MNIDLTQLINVEDKAAQVQEKRRAGVNGERDRRLADGATVTIAGYGDVPVQGRTGDQINLIAVADTARELIAAGYTTVAIPFRDGDNVVHGLTPSQVLEMARKGKEAAAAIYSASWALKDAEAVPAEFADDIHWP
ncbi:DUF4376 domain-containing protein [Oceaniovalibus sp. ACAM 378]|uniref:DUF4376 domain-containing protein n=1 Tax=Oceaniovalibus sp. ACAM 378 TaxID=2599923 RepID=UPI0011D638F8|nr:DUF4376 domain-containing protein [Oceaniovalibus sp. ACAM 378]TYB83978.1 hypothetical protein FQ320_23450 [Oceaniovalibus sp. ACAM 378]